MQGIGAELAARIVSERESAPYTSMNDVVRRTGMSVAQTEALATAGAFDGFGLSRRQALWNAGYADSQHTLPGSAIDASPPELPGMSPAEVTLADLWATKISPSDHPVGHLRAALVTEEVVAIEDLGPQHDGRRVKVAGLITHRQRPGTAGGVTFLNLEDETGMLNIVCSSGVWSHHRRIARQASAMIIRGKIEHSDGVTNLVADSLIPLAVAVPQAVGTVPARSMSRDFH